VGLGVRAEVLVHPGVRHPARGSYIDL